MIKKSIKSLSGLIFAVLTALVFLAVALVEILFYLGLLVVVFGGAWFVLDHYGILVTALLPAV